MNNSILNSQPNKTENTNRDEIAIVGLGCRYPGAKNAKELWENIITRRRQFRRMPDVRLPLSDYQDDDKSISDKTYGTRAAVIDGYEFDWQGHRIPKKTAETTDIAHWLTLDVVLQMLEDANYTPDKLPCDKTQVIIGNTLTGEFTRSNMLRLRWPFINKLLQKNGKKLGIEKDRLAMLTEIVEEQFKSISPETNEDSLAGGLANTIAGRVCNYLNLNGGGYTVDGACSSSLIAVYTAATHLANGTIDFAIAGGVDISLDPFELIGFAKTGALTQNDMTVYDKRGSGFIPGEGCGIVGMKRLADAQRDGDKIYAVLDGWGVSSDGKGGITAPTVKGQAIALRRAYEKAGIDTRTINFIEGHGTGTKVGDRVELLAIAEALGGSDTVGERNCGVTSFKSIVGHTKAAAGIGAFIKAVLGVNQRVVPPTAGCQQPHDAFDQESACLYPILRGKALPESDTVRAGVSAMGFGGINLHVTLAADEITAKKVRDYVPAIGERAAFVSNQDSEVFCFGANHRDGLLLAINDLRKEAKDISLAELADLAAMSNVANSPNVARFKASLIVRTPKELEQKLQALQAHLMQTVNHHPICEIEPGIFLSVDAKKAQLGWMFPGQGSQRPNMARALVERFQWAQDLVQQADAWAAELGTQGLADALFSIDDKSLSAEQRQQANETLRQTQIAQPAITLVSLLWATYLQRLGIKADVVMGHSLGELSAFYTAGAFDAKALIQLATLRGQLMTSKQGDGTMLSLACNAEQAAALIDAVKHKGTVVLANLNSPRNTVASGHVAAIDALEALANTQGVRAKKLVVSNAFHSPLVADAAQQLQNCIPVKTLQTPLSYQLISACDGSDIHQGIDLADYFSQQIIRQVNFIAAAARLEQNCDLVLEVGPGAVLSQLVQQNTSQLRTQAVESEAESFQDINQLLGLVFIHGHHINWQEVYAQRAIHPFVSPSMKQFLTNPCERVAGLFDEEFDEELKKQEEQSPVFHSNQPEFSALAKRNPDVEESARFVQTHGSQQYAKKIAEMVAEFTGFDAGSITLEANLLDDLNLDSIKSAELVGRITRHFNAQENIDPANYATATLSQLVADMGLQTNAAVVTPVTKPDEAVNEQHWAKDIASVVADFTGFDAVSINLEANLLDDLNLDSIKSAELAGRIAKHFDAQEKIDPANYATATLAQLAQDLGLSQEKRVSTEITQTIVESTPIALESAVNTIAEKIDSAWQSSLLNIVADFTGFEATSMALDANVLDDLNLDSIKSAELVGRIAKHFNAQEKIDPANYATATLAQIAEDMGLAKNTSTTTTVQKQADVADEPQEEGVNQFYRVLQASELPIFNTQAFIKGKQLTVFYSQSDASLNALSDYLEKIGAFYRLVCIDEKVDEHTSTNSDGYIVLLPNQATFNQDISITLDTNNLFSSVQRLYRGAVEAQKQQPALGICFVQFGGSDQGDQWQGGDFCSAASSAFAATLHLENPTLPVQVVDFHRHIDPTILAEKIVNEFSHTQAYCYSHYNQQGERFLLTPVRINKQIQQTPRGIEWNERDVVLVTGGGKGITAECALAFAQQHRVRMVLVGSSPMMPENHSLQETLARYRRLGLLATYKQCDIADADAVKQLVAAVEVELGAITGVIHGAGLNKAKRLEQSSPESALAEIAPKLLGMQNICAALAAKPPKLILAFSSIIGVTGMPGNAWYAYSNEALNLLLQQFSSKHPQTQTQALAYSVWGEVGMGARMGSVKRLANLGITAIPTEEGVETFLQAAMGNNVSHHLIVTGSLGGLDTWQPITETVERIEATPQADRFLQEIVSYQAQQYCIARATLSIDDDYYLLDHNYRGSYLFPTVFGLEAMGQAVARLLEVQQLPPLTIRNINLSRPIVVGSENNKQSTTIQITATREVDTQNIKVGISTEQSGFTRDHFSAVFELQQPQQQTEDLRASLPAEPIAIDPKTELYGGLLFQGSLFQRLESVWTMDSRGSSTRIVNNTKASYFSNNFSEGLILGDPCFRDVLLQSAQLSVKGILLPVYIDRLEWNGATQQSEHTVLAKTTVITRDRDGMECGVVAVDETSGALVERLSGYQLKQMEHDDAGPAPEDWANPETRDSAQLNSVLHDAAKVFGLYLPKTRLTYAPQLHNMKRDARHVEESPIFQELAQEVLNTPTMLDIQWTEEGKPFIVENGVPGEEQVSLSLSHDDRHCLYSAGKTVQGCDIEPVIHRTKDIWLSLFAVQHHSAFEKLIVESDSINTAGTRLWCALESIRKAGGEDIALKAIKFHGDACLLKFSVDQQTLMVLTLAIELTRPPKKIVAIVVKESVVKESVVNAGAVNENTLTENHHAIAINPTSIMQANKTLTDINTLENKISSRIQYDNQQHPSLCYRFMVTFKDVTTANREVNFDTYADWMGMIRERAIATVASEMVPDFVSGQWGMVTNHSKVDIFSPLKCMDLVEARLTIKRVYGQCNSSVDMQFDWLKITDDDLETLAARSVMATTWVEIIGHGQVRVKPFPRYMQQLVEDYLPASGATDLNPDNKKPIPKALLGEALFETPNTPRLENIVATQRFETTSAESNLVGNIYYANYYHWQSKAIDKTLFKVKRELGVSDVSLNGELLCAHSQVSHLREAMPYDTIEVDLSIKGIYSKGVHFQLEVYRLDYEDKNPANKKRTKLTLINNYSVWQSKTSGETIMPAIFRDALLVKVTQNKKESALISHLPTAITADKYSPLSA